jgi:hypothetical protein
MLTKVLVRIIYLMALAISGMGCTQTQTTNQSQKTDAEVLSKNQLPEQKSALICPIPPTGHENIPGYKASRVDPSLSQSTLKIISPTASGRAHISDIYTTIEFCGIARNELVKVKLFSSSAGIKENQISLEIVKNLIGEATVRDGLWFISYKFTTKGNRAVLAKGYDKDGKLITTSSPVSLLQIYSPNP